MTITNKDYSKLETLWKTGTEGSLVFENGISSKDLKAIKIRAFKSGYLLYYKDNTVSLKPIAGAFHAPKPEAVAIKQEKEEAPEDVFEKIPGFENYHVPAFLKQVITMMKADRAMNFWFSGPSGCGKTTAARYLATALNRKLYKLNGDGGTTPSNFFGANTVVIDKETGKNKIVFSDGIAVRAMQEGLDEQGNICGEPGILFIDEAASLPPSVGISLNALLETRNKIREISLSEDGGRVVKSHPGFVIVLAGNTNGLGASSNQQQYSAQRRALDASMIQRITATFRFGYDKLAEREIISRNIFDCETAVKFMNFKDCLRKAMKDGEILTPFSTTKVIDICDAFHMFKAEQENNVQALANAVKFCYFESVLQDEMAAADELFRVCFGKKATEFTKSDDENYDYI